MTYTTRGLLFEPTPFFLISSPLVARTPGFPERISALYHDAVESLRFFKRQQWTVTNYVLAIYAAVFVLRSETFLTTCKGKALLIGLGVITWLANIFVLCQLEENIIRDRNRTDRLHEDYFSPEEISRLELNPSNSWRDHLILYLLIVVSSIGCAISCLTVWYYAH